MAVFIVRTCGDASLDIIIICDLTESSTDAVKLRVRAAAS